MPEVIWKFPEGVARGKFSNYRGHLQIHDGQREFIMQIHDKKPNLLQIFFNSPMNVLRQVCISICSHGRTLPFLGILIIIQGIIKYLPPFSLHISQFKDSQFFLLQLGQKKRLPITTWKRCSFWFISFVCRYSNYNYLFQVQNVGGSLIQSIALVIIVKLDNFVSCLTIVDKRRFELLRSTVRFSTGEILRMKLS